MSEFVILDQGEPTTVEGETEESEVWVEADNGAAALSWELKPEGLCKEDVCIPVGDDLLSGGKVSLETLAGLLGRPLAMSVEHGAAYLGPPITQYAETVGSLKAPDFTLPDLDGHTHTLSEHRGSKVLLAAWASW